MSAAAPLIGALMAAVALEPPPGGALGPRLSLEEIVSTRTLGHFSLSPDGRSAAYVLAGFYFGFPVIPRLGEDNNVRVVRLDGGRGLQVTTGPRPKTHPVFSPDGTRIAFESEDDVWVVEIATGESWRVTTSGARDRDAAWSPDGRRLVFASDRGGRTDLWIAAVDGERHGLARLTSDAATEEDPQWSPDGSVIAFGAQRPDDHYYASGIYRVAAAGGTPERVTPVDPSDNACARFSPDGSRLAYVSDRGGFARVWIAAADGSQAREIDSGPFDAASPHWRVEPRWSRDGRQILISVNRDGGYDLVRIDVRSGSARVLRAGGGLHHAVGFAYDGAPVFVHESASSPPDLFTFGEAGEARPVTHSGHASFRPEHFAERRRVGFASTDGFELRARLLVPRGLRPGQRVAAIVNLHPNSYGQFVDGWSPFFDVLAASGYAVLNLDQRGSAGHGRAYRDAAIGAWGTLTLEDVKAAAAWLKAQPFVDGARVGVMGLSFGGYLTLLALVQEPALFAAGLDLMGVADRRGALAGRNFVFHVGKTEAEAPELYARLSPITQVKALRAPLLVLHSDQDRNVAPEQTYRLVDELRRQEKPFEVHIYPGEAHGLADPAHQLDSYRRILAFLDRTLGAGQSKEELPH
jgi:dipeptidyl aminopeptidase/acylaminoacyl peptidase